MEPEDEYQELNEGENSGPSFLSLYSSRLRYFGGAGNCGGHCAPYKKDEFKIKNYFEYSDGQYPIKIWKVTEQAANMLGISHKKFYDESLLGNTFKEKSLKSL